MSELSAERRTIEDGFGSEWEVCPFDERGRCGLEIVRPGKVQCGFGAWCPNDLRGELLAFLHSVDLPDYRREFFRSNYRLSVEGGDLDDAPAHPPVTGGGPTP